MAGYLDTNHVNLLLNILTLLGIIGSGGALIWWIRGMPERARVKNEGIVIAAAEAADRYKVWRLEVHELKQEVAKVSARQYLTDKQLSDALAVNRHNKSQMATMLFLIKLLISELKRLDPKSAIVHQAEMTLVQMEHDHGMDPTKSDALNTAEVAVQDAKQTVRSAEATCEEVKKDEAAGGNGK